MACRRAVRCLQTDPPMKRGIFLAFVLLAAPARATEPKPIAVEGQAGLGGAPLGTLGIALDLSPLPELAVNGGVGLGFTGIQFAASGRGRLRLGEDLLSSAGLGYSKGPFLRENSLEDYVLGESPAKKYDDARWLNFELGIEHHLESGWHFRGFGGVGVLLNPRSAHCDHPNSSAADACQREIDRTEWLLLPYIGGAIGFGL
jgi:hypothetical protein